MDIYPSHSRFNIHILNYANPTSLTNMESKEHPPSSPCPLEFKGKAYIYLQLIHKERLECYKITLLLQSYET